MQGPKDRKSGLRTESWDWCCNCVLENKPTTWRASEENAAHKRSCCQ